MPHNTVTVTGTVAGSGPMGRCPVYFVILGIFLLLPGASFTGVGYSGDWDDPFFTMTPVFKVLGPILLTVSLVLIIVGIILCAVVARKLHHGTNNSANVTYSTTTVTTGDNPGTHYYPPPPTGQQYPGYPGHAPHQPGPVGSYPTAPPPPVTQGPTKGFSEAPPSYSEAVDTNAV